MSKPKKIEIMEAEMLDMFQWEQNIDNDMIIESIVEEQQW